jgi:hypothetical protein
MGDFQGAASSPEVVVPEPVRLRGAKRGCCRPWGAAAGLLSTTQSAAAGLAVRDQRSVIPMRADR